MKISKKIVSLGAALALAVCMSVTAFATNEADDNLAMIGVNDISESADAEDSGSLELSKGVGKNDDGSYTLTLESYSEGAAYSKDSEVVIIVDQSGSMYSAVEDDSIWDSYGEFVANADTTAGQYPGYYVAVQKYDYATTGPTSDPDKFDEDYDYACALIKYDAAEQKWKRSTQIRISKKNYETCTGGFVFLDSLTTGDNSWHDFSANSNNYGDKSDTKYYKTITGATVTSLESFLDEVEGTDNCKVAVVGFSSLPSRGETEKKNTDTEQNANKYGWKYGGTGVFVNGNFVHYNNCTDSTYADAFLSVSDVAEFSLLQDTVQSIYTDYHGTTTDAGFVLANNLFAASDAAREADGRTGEVNRTVILFTDGEPTERITTGFANNDGGQRDAAVSAAYTAKHTYGAHLHAFGPGRGEAIAQEFLDCLSSNYPNAKTMSNKGDKASSNYAGLATSSEDLESTFKEIGQQVAESATTLNGQTVLYDKVSSSFMLPKGADEDNITVYTAAYNGDGTFGDLKPFEGAHINIDADKGEIRVSGYDYSTEYVSNIKKEDGTFGSKLVVKIPIVTKPDFLGGNGVETNDGASGIYYNGEKVSTFEIPKIDVAVDEIEPAFKAGKIYLSEKAVVPHVANIGHFKYKEYNDDGSLASSWTETTFDGVNNKYVNVTYTISDKPFVEDSDGTLKTEGDTRAMTVPAGWVHGDQVHNANVSEWAGNLDLNPTLTDDAVYYVKVDVSPVEEGTYSDTTVAGSSAIEVYKPVVTFQDSTMNLGQTANYEGDDPSSTVTRNYVSIAWTHGDAAAVVGEMGPAPELSYAYGPKEGAFKAETPVKVTSIFASAPDNVSDYEHEVDTTLNLLTVEGAVTFYRDSCGFCSHESGVVVEGDANFVVHIELGDLTILKRGLEEPVKGATSTKIGDDGASKTAGAGESALFIIEGCGLSKEVVVAGNGSVVVKSLPVGTYKVTELTNWTWGSTLVGAYNATDPANLVELSVVGGTTYEIEVTRSGATIKFVNGGDGSWLHDDCWCKNVFDKIKVASSDATGN